MIYSSNNKNKKGVFASAIVAVLIIVIMILSFIYYYNHTVIIGGRLIGENLTDLVYQIDNVGVENGKLTITGWCFRKNEDTSDREKKPGLRIILANTNNYEDLRYFRADYGLERPGVGPYFNNDGYNYSNCGFIAEIDTKKLDLENTDYEIVIQQNERNAGSVKTGVYIHEGQMMFTDPQSYVSLDVENTDLEEITKNGFLRVNRPDEGMYVYQYGNRLYWIAEEKYPLDNGWNFICYLLETTQVEKLPEDRLAIGVDFDNIGMYFTDNEITDTINCGKYRVSVRDIPSEYAVAVISTGYYEDGAWVWRERFFPHYYFD
ncbi:MAG: hypothetical protein IJ106_12005 [Parasporobacterium sp.]|nr:hypothetical protein [Parasporobacterium sp.]